MRWAKWVEQKDKNLLGANVCELREGIKGLGKSLGRYYRWPGAIADTPQEKTKAGDIEFWAARRHFKPINRRGE